MTLTLMVYSEAGGVTKTATAFSVAMAAAEMGRRVILVDLDPRAAATRWIGVEPAEAGLHVGAILADPDPTGWAEDLAVTSAWSPQLRVIPSARAVSNREADRDDMAAARLKIALHGAAADLVVIDCPNRQGGPLTLAAMTAADQVVYAATASNDGLDGVDGARKTISVYHRHREQLGAPVDLTEAGIVVGAVRDVVMPRASRFAIDEMRATGLLLTPLVPDRAIVQESRISGEWYGRYSKGQPVAEAYRTITTTLLKES